MAADAAPLVLLVEDDQDVRDGLCEILELEGVRVKAARDGAEGLDFLQQGTVPRAVFLDDRMPRLDGRGLLAAMQNDPRLAEIPIVWMSGDTRAAPRVAAVLEKPFSTEDLLEIVGSLRGP